MRTYALTINGTIVPRDHLTAMTIGPATPGPSRYRPALQV